jgi:outer membrane immunogenic protein
MKRIAIALLTSAAVVGLSQAASAADMNVKAAYVAPAPVPTWTGFYIGVHGGAGWQSAPSWSAVNPNFPAVGFAPQTLTGSPGMGAVGGLQLGYNYQFSPAWVVGVEGDFSWTSLGDNRTTRTGTPASIAGGLPPPVTVSMSENTEWLASARGRIGFTGWLNNTLLFATGGVAWTGREYNAATFDTLNGNAHQLATSNTTKSGWVVGGGAEWQATTNILLRAEYLYYNFNGSFTGNAIGTNVAGVPLANQPLPSTFTFNSYNVQVARIAVSYKF